MRQLTLLFLLCLATLASVAVVSHLNADAAPPPPDRPVERPRPPERPEAAKAESVSLVTDDYAGLTSERTKEGNWVFSLSFTVPAANYEGVLDEIKKDDEARAIRVYATIKPTGENGAQVLTKRTVKPEFSNLRVGTYVVQLWLRTRDGEYQPRSAWVVAAK